MKRGDLVTCPAHPEWGEGIVLRYNHRLGLWSIDFEHRDRRWTRPDEVVPVPPDPQTEPVAWLIRWANARTEVVKVDPTARIDTPAFANGVTVTPLYTQAPSLPDDRRIAREAIALLADGHDGCSWCPMGYRCEVADFLARPDVQAIREDPT